jgi:hypothetical protein
MFASIARAYLIGASTCSPLDRLLSMLAKVTLERSYRDKHSSLFGSFVSYKEKSFALLKLALKAFINAKV